jgi:hypothetical protein
MLYALLEKFKDYCCSAGFQTGAARSSMLLAEPEPNDVPPAQAARVPAVILNRTNFKKSLKIKNINYCYIQHLKAFKSYTI